MVKISHLTKAIGLSLVLGISMLNMDHTIQAEDKSYTYDYHSTKEGMALNISGVGNLADGCYHEMVGTSSEFMEKYPNNTTMLIINDGITGIGDYCFSGLDIKVAYIADSVAKLGKECFPQNMDVFGNSLSAAEEIATKYHASSFNPLDDQLRGDINKNGSYDAEDALMILEMVVGLRTKYGYTADIDCSNKYNLDTEAEDALTVLKLAVGIMDISELQPVWEENTMWNPEEAKYHLQLMYEGRFPY